MDGSQKPGFIETLKVYFQLPMLIVLGLGMASGFPLLLTGSTLAARMQENGVDIGLIGMFALVGLPYTFKFLWAPLVDAIKLGKTHLTHRRIWLWLSQLGLIGSLLGLAVLDPNSQLVWLGVFALLTSFFSATQDIIIDALRVEMLKTEDQGAGAAMYVAGYRVGMLLAGAGALMLAHFFPWHLVYVVAILVMAAFMPLGLAIRGLAGVEQALAKQQAESADKDFTDKTGDDCENAVSNDVESQESVSEGEKAVVVDKSFKTKLVEMFCKAVVAPLKDFFVTRGVKTALSILLFIALYKLGDAMAGNLSMPFYLSIGFTKPEIAAISKVFGFGAVLVGTALGGLVVKKYSMAKALLICGSLQLLSNFVFVWLAGMGHSIPALIVAIAVENVTGGMGTAAFVAFMASLCHVEFTATQYALFSALSSVGRTAISSVGGYIVDASNWQVFFCVTAVAGLPGMALLLALGPQLNAERQTDSSV